MFGDPPLEEPLGAGLGGGRILRISPLAGDLTPARVHGPERGTHGVVSWVRPPNAVCGHSYGAAATAPFAAVVMREATAWGCDT